MKSSHKIALALSIFLLATLSAYFIFAHFTDRGQSSEQHNAEPPAIGAMSNSSSTPSNASSEQQVTASEVRQLQTMLEERPQEAAAPELASSPPSTQSYTVASVSQTAPVPVPTAAPQPEPSAVASTASATTSSATSSESRLSEESAPSSGSTAAVSPSGATGSQLDSSPATDLELENEVLANMSSSELYNQVTKQPVDFYEISDREKEQWQEFKLKYRRSYADEQEEMRRQEVFINNLRFIETFNKKSRAQFTLGMNHFGDHNRAEINQLFIGPQTNWSQVQSSGQAAMPPPIKILDDPSSLAAGGQQDQSGPSTGGQLSVDWRPLAATDPVDQANCRESALFAVTANLELKVNQLLQQQQQQQQQQQNTSSKLKLSEAQLLDCFAHEARVPVCLGSLTMMQVFEFLQKKSLRLASAQEYSVFLQAKAAGQAPAELFCNILASAAEPRPMLHSFNQVHRDNLDEALQNGGPLVVALDASLPSFHFYKSGVYHEQACSQDSYNLHVLLVGQAAGSPAGHQVAAEDRSTAAYVIRASFGSDWGEAGHMRLSKDVSENKCLPQNFAIYPNVQFA